MKEFERFKDLFYTNGRTKKWNSQLQKDALDWFRLAHGAKFSAETHWPKEHYKWCYNGGMLLFDMGFGQYHYAFIIQILHFNAWKTAAWRSGLKYGKRCLTSKMKLTNNNYRDANPYSTIQFYENKAWDAGYMYGLHIHQVIKRR